MKRRSFRQIEYEVAWDLADPVTKILWSLLFVIGPLILIGFVVVNLILWAL